jgi:predicted MFS family arabinose efflux permease
MPNRTECRKPALAVRLPAAFNRLAWSNLAAQSAEQLSLAAAPIVAVLVFGAGAGETGWLQTVQTLPFLLLSIPAGVLADRMSRRRLMVAAEALRAIALAAILALAALGHLTLPLLAALGFAAASGTVAYSVAAPALVPSLVPAEALPSANARIELARTIAFAGGPALAGVLVGWTGGAPAFGVAAALSVVAVLLLGGLHEPARTPAAPRHPLIEVREGAAFVFRHALLRPVFVTQFIFGVAFFMLSAVYVPYAVHDIGLSAAKVGATLAAYGVGMIAGALAAPRIIGALAFGTVIAIGPITGFIAAALMALTILMPSGALAAASFFLMGAGPIVWVISTTTLRQSVTPAALLGRASAINIMAYGSRPIGSALGALVGGLYGAQTCLIVAAGLFAAQALVIVASAVPRLVRQPALVD